MIKTTSLLNHRLINSERCLETLDGGDTHGILFYKTPLSFSGMAQKLHWELVLLGFCGKISPFKLSLSQILWINIISHEQHKTVFFVVCSFSWVGMGTNQVLYRTD